MAVDTSQLEIGTEKDKLRYAKRHSARLKMKCFSSPHYNSYTGKLEPSLIHYFVGKMNKCKCGLERWTDD